MGQYVIWNNKLSQYFSKLNHKKQIGVTFMRIQIEWTTDIDQSSFFNTREEAHSIIYENNLDNVELIEEPSTKKIIHEINMDDLFIFQSEMNLKKSILMRVEETLIHLKEKGIKDDNLKEELNKYLMDKGITIGVPITLFGNLIKNPKVISDVNINKKIIPNLISFRKFIEENIENILNQELGRLSISDNFCYMGYFRKLKLMKYNKLNDYYNFIVFLKFKIKLKSKQKIKIESLNLFED